MTCPVPTHQRDCLLTRILSKHCPVRLLLPVPLQTWYWSPSSCPSCELFCDFRSAVLWFPSPTMPLLPGFSSIIIAVECYYTPCTVLGNLTVYQPLFHLHLLLSKALVLMNVCLWHSIIYCWLNVTAVLLLILFPWTLLLF